MPFCIFILSTGSFYRIGLVRMPYYATHLLVGLLCSLPFYRLDKKDRLRTIIAGMFAGVLPDIDGFLQFIPHPESVNILVRHRGFWHWWGLPLIFGLLSIILVFQIHDKSKRFDISLTLLAVFCAWMSHLILDFGFTTYTSPALILEIPWHLVLIADQISSLLLSALLAYLLFLRDTLV